MYIKEFPYLSSVEIAALARHSKEISAALSDSEEVIVPDVLGHDHTSISYSIVDCSSPLSDKLRNFSCTEQEMIKAGKVLRRIHIAGILHTDYVPHNIFCSDQKLVVIDAHPPEGIHYKHELLYGDPQNEISRFVFALLSNIGLKRTIRHFDYQSRMVKGFLEGYGKPMYPFSQLLGATLSSTKEIYFLKRRARIAPVHAIAHCALGWVLTCTVLRQSL